MLAISQYVIQQFGVTSPIFPSFVCKRGTDIDLVSEFQAAILARRPNRTTLSSECGHDLLQELGIIDNRFNILTRQ